MFISIVCMFMVYIVISVSVVVVDGILSESWEGYSAATPKC